MKLSIILIAGVLGQIGSPGSITGSIIPNDAQCQALFQSQMQGNADACPGVNVVNPVGNKNTCQTQCVSVLRAFVNSAIVGICAGSSVELNVIYLIVYQVQQCAIVISTRPLPTTTVPVKTTPPQPTITTTTNSGNSTQPIATTVYRPVAQYPTMAGASRPLPILLLISVFF
ncbi:hypothetical protein HDV01_002188 [Terramyces sp. JEL0728]|nr:hypothetical protein HDV01_002188 [Terramyces sp. JEL0728]